MCFTLESALFQADSRRPFGFFSCMLTRPSPPTHTVLLDLFQVHPLSDRPEGRIFMVDGLHIQWRRETPWEPPGGVEGLGSPATLQAPIWSNPAFILPLSGLEMMAEAVLFLCPSLLWLNYCSTNKFITLRIIFYHKGLPVH